jgi:uncharacterized protein
MDTSEIVLRPTRVDLFWPRLAEFVVLYALLPLPWLFIPLPGMLIPTLLTGMAFCLVLLLRDPAFDRAQLWNLQAAVRRLPAILAIFIGGAALVTIATLVVRSESFAALPRRNPLLWTAIMVGYPLLSVYPQEVIYRVFFFHRYAALFPTPAWMIAANAAAFAFAHILFQNPLAITLTLVGGGMFAWTYRRTRSAAAVWIEHTLYGCLLFTVGLGEFFYLGARLGQP